MATRIALTPTEIEEAIGDRMDELLGPFYGGDNSIIPWRTKLEALAELLAAIDAAVKAGASGTPPNQLG